MKSTRLRNTLIVTYLAVQVLVPLRGLFLDAYDTRGNFSWNMYSRTYRCRVSYRVMIPDGPQFLLDHKDYFKRPGRATQVFHRDVLPRFHAFLCEDMRRNEIPGTIQGTAACRVNYDERRELIEPGVDLCTSPNYGVRDP